MNTIFKKIALPIAMSIALITGAVGMTGCSSIAQVTSEIATSVSSSTPEQARTLEQAYHAATIVTEAVRVYVNVGNPDRATLVQLQKLNLGLRETLAELDAANKAGKSLTFAAFNEALKAFKAYATVKGVKQ